ncbi:MAG TPA: hypothetical protein VF202_14810, partial [Trueperaceae bacterium]
TPYLGYDEGYGFVPSETHRAVLIATHVRHKPVLALLEDVEPLPARDDTAELVEALRACIEPMVCAADVCEAEGASAVAWACRAAVESARAVLARVRGVS